MDYYNDFDAQTHHYYQQYYEKKYKEKFEKKLKEDLEKLEEERKVNLKELEEERQAKLKKYYKAMLKEGIPEEKAKKIFSEVFPEIKLN